MEIFKPAWKSYDREKSKKAISNMLDQKKLLRATQEAPDFSIRVMAAKKLTDKNLAQEIFANFAKSESSAVLSIKSSIFLELTNATLLEDVAKNAKYAEIREQAVKKLTNQTVLADIAKNDDTDWVQEAAIKKMTDISLLTDIAENTKFFKPVAMAERLISVTTGGDDVKYTEDFRLNEIARKRLAELDDDNSSTF